MYGILAATLITVTSFSIIGMALKIFKLYFKRSAREYFVELVANLIIAVLATVIVYYACEQIAIENLLWNFLARMSLCAILSLIILLSVYSCSKTYRLYFKDLSQRLHS